MEYRRLGRSGLRVSVLGLGTWMTFGATLSGSTAEECLAAAYEAGVNFFDTAEAYGAGESERVLGQAIANLGWPRYSYIVSTKFYWGIHEGVNTRRTLNRKYLLQAIDASLERLGLEFVDIVYCHRPDPDTALEESVWTMHDIVASGKATYWGTSEFSAPEIEAIFALCERHHLRPPIVEQPEYNMIERRKVEGEFRSLYDTYGIGLTTFSPLASGVLTGKYVDGIPEGSRATSEGFDRIRARLTDREVNERVRALKPIADEIGCSLAQLAIAWCMRNPHVSSVITGASRVAQLNDNLGALDVVAALSEERCARIDAIVA